jgi:hypothetical protein
MAVSTQEIGKKAVEAMEFAYFAASYKHVTGRDLSILRKSERPDFICRWKNVKPVGVELTSAPSDAFDIYLAAAEKAEKMKSGNWSLDDRTILVIFVDELPVSLIHEGAISVTQEYENLGFFEVWLADESDLEAFGTVQLFCLWPQRWYGFHARPNAGMKPYD